MANLLGYLVIEAAIAVTTQGIDLLLLDIVIEICVPCLWFVAIVNPLANVGVKRIPAIEMDPVDLDTLLSHVACQVGEKRTKRTLQE